VSKSSTTFKEALLVTLGGIVILPLSFVLYFLLFRLFEGLRGPEGPYMFVSTLRIGYGVAWLIGVFLVYRTKWNDLVKAVLLIGAITSFLAAVGVQLWEVPALFRIIIIVTLIVTAILLRRRKSNWYHFYAAALACAAAFLYALPGSA